MKKNLLSNPIFIFMMFLFTSIITSISSVHFLSVMITGIQFLAFRKTLQDKYYYSLLFVLASFLFIEYNNGFKPFSLILLAFFVNTFIIPYLKRVLSFSTLNYFVYIAIFYLGVLFIWSISHTVSMGIYLVILYNIIIDFIIFGLFI